MSKKELEGNGTVKVDEKETVKAAEATTVEVVTDEGFIKKACRKAKAGVTKVFKNEDGQTRLVWKIGLPIAVAGGAAGIGAYAAHKADQNRFDSIPKAIPGYSEDGETIERLELMGETYERVVDDVVDEALPEIDTDDIEETIDSTIDEIEEIGE